ncbi:hypothetical protein PFICI_09304 [Pestalotiopsis fici W106-1]|uniref:Mitochondrial carrier protein pet8 n=1 Tax=Pestalotiopsis fici (strain W106-1 / CGMCC3.15140) TaxID=1229662 RepID=W3X2S1_PESFW|nr:uncharacterized protein PFICI_09304 [Pestalotiopsis fici W106-1]ETS79451.1 hypothetical protein PFICI_09304 [Pestalotiopsis fici W106-1]
MASRTFLSAFRPAAALASRQTIASRSIASSAVLRHKEDSLHDPESTHEALNKSKNGKEWKPELASNSEEAVRADRENTDDIKTLQEKTKKQAEQKK